MQIRIIRPIPAPFMDGFKVGDFLFGADYDLERVEKDTADYLLVAGYAVQVANVKADNEQSPVDAEPSLTKS
jgi:hypothetical protein